jgi:tetratricopeptide (TPR) repeat protein
MTDKSRRERIEEMLAEDPGDAFLRYSLGMEHASAGQPEEAMRCFEELLRRSPDYVPGYMQAGKVLQQLDRLDEARSMWQTGVSVARRQNDAHAADEMESFLDGLD